MGHRHAEAWNYNNPSRRTTTTQLPGVPNGSPAAGKQRPASTPFIILKREYGHEGDSGLRARGTDRETWHSHGSKVLPQRAGGAPADGAGLKSYLSGRRIGGWRGSEILPQRAGGASADGWFYFCCEQLTPKHGARDGREYRGPAAPHSLGDADAASLAAISCARHAGRVRAGPLWRGSSLWSQSARSACMRAAAPRAPTTNLRQQLPPVWIRRERVLPNILTPSCPSSDERVALSH